MDPISKAKVSPRLPIIAVLGAGVIGERIIKDLLATFDGSVVVMGRHLPALKKNFKSKRLEFRIADVTKPLTLQKALKGIDLVIHAVHHEYNETVMRACLKSKTHYLDLGGLYHYTLKQLKFDATFRRAKLTAVLGMGAAPGITNVLAAYGAQKFERIEAIEIRVGMADRSTYKQISSLDNSYSLQTILEECSFEPAVFKNNKMIFLEPFSGREVYSFPAPVGIQNPQYTIHSELATLPQTLHARNVFFKIAFAETLVEQIRTLQAVGLLTRENLSKTLGILKQLPPTIPKTIEQYEIIQVVIRGTRGKTKKTLRLEAHVPTVGETVDKDTAVAASIVAQWIVNGECSVPGVYPPESIVPPEAFFQELCHRGIFIYQNGRKIF